MISAALLYDARATGVTLWVEGDALRYRGPREALAKLLPALKAHKPDILAALAHPDPLPPLSRAAEARRQKALALSAVPPEFAARLSAEDLDDIATGDIPLGTVQALEEAAIAREAEDLREHFEERAGIIEFDAGLLRPEAELEAGRIVATYARNRSYSWASLRAALSGPEKIAIGGDHTGAPEVKA